MPQPGLKSDLGSVILPALKEDYPYFSLDMIRGILRKQRGKLSNATLKIYISRFVDEGVIHDAGRGWYSRIEEPFRLDTSPIKKIIALIKTDFPLLGFSCWSTDQVNPYMHHLLGKTVTLVFTDRDLMPAVFEKVKGRVGYRFYLDPSAAEAKKNFQAGSKIVIIRPEIQGAPKAGEAHAAPIERLLPDLAIEVEKLPLMSRGEFQDMAWRLITSARISMGTLLRYAQRRNRGPEDIFGNNWYTNVKK